MKRAVLYMRVSTRDQNIENQRRRLKDFCELKGWDLAGEYKDRISGMKDRRPGLNQLLGDARKRKFDVVVSWKLDRLGRSTSHLLTLIEELRVYSVDVAFSEQPIDTTTHMGRFVYTILGAVAELEREQIRERVNLGLDRARAEGVKLGRPTLRDQYPRSYDKVKRLREEGLSYRKISEQTGIPKSSIGKIIKEGVD